MKTLLLWRHATAASGEASGSDRDRPLEPRGHAEAADMAARIAARDEIPALVLLSPARRAEETLAPLRPRLTAARIQADERLYTSSGGGILSLVQDVSDTDECVLVVGHNPALAGLARELAGSGTPEKLRQLGRFPPGALAILEHRGAWRDLAPGRERLLELWIPDGS